MIIQKITNKDSLDIWQWINDKKSIFLSKNKKKVTLDFHNKWFEKNLKNKKKKFYIGCMINKKLKKKLGLLDLILKTNML